VTELDLQALGIWWIPLARPDERSSATLNAWAIEDAALGITLYGCGPGGSEALAALSNGLAEAGATLRDVGRIIVPGAQADHSGALTWILKNAVRPVEVVASRSVLACLPAPNSAKRDLLAGDRLEFRWFAATAMRCEGPVPALTCLYAERDGVLLSADHLVDDPGTYARVAAGATPGINRDAYRASLARLGELQISVVLPGRGPPFAGHRRVIRDALARLAQRRDPSEDASSGTARLRPDPLRAQRRAQRPGSRTFVPVRRIPLAPKSSPQSPRSSRAHPSQGEAG
jgi:glyoxylase-like metal-dependent hydrolase (beta-lactamase superfamily II)